MTKAVTTESEAAVAASADEAPFDIQTLMFLGDSEEIARLTEEILVDLAAGDDIQPSHPITGS